MLIGLIALSWGQQGRAVDAARHLEAAVDAYDVSTASSSVSGPAASLVSLSV